MATRKAGSRLETEIERCRSECQWERIPELVKQLSAKLIANDDMAELLLGESKLEQHLKEKPLRQGASPRGPRPQLTEVRKHLTAALDRGNLKSEFLQESNLIMAKLNYVEGDYKEALNIYARVGLDDLPLTAVPPYRLRMIAEAYATKGLCLEKLPISSSTSDLHVDREQDVITCYEKAGDIALLYLQEIERVILTNIQNRSPKPGPAPHDQELGFFLETGLQRAHVLYFKNGNLTRGVGRFRELLRAVETRTTQNLRMTIARQLAEILLRGMCEQSYWNPLEDPPCQSPLDDPLRKGANTKTYTLPRRARVYSGEKYGLDVLSWGPWHGKGTWECLGARREAQAVDHVKSGERGNGAIQQSAPTLLTAPAEEREGSTLPSMCASFLSSLLSVSLCEILSIYHKIPSITQQSTATVYSRAK